MPLQSKGNRALRIDGDLVQFTGGRWLSWVQGKRKAEAKEAGKEAPGKEKEKREA